MEEEEEEESMNEWREEDTDSVEGRKEGKKSERKKERKTMCWAVTTHSLPYIISLSIDAVFPIIFIIRCT